MGTFPSLHSGENHVSHRYVWRDVVPIASLDIIRAVFLADVPGSSIQTLIPRHLIGLSLLMTAYEVEVAPSSFSGCTAAVLVATSCCDGADVVSLYVLAL